jgi:hypothetical protein
MKARITYAARGEIANAVVPPQYCPHGAKNFDKLALVATGHIIKGRRQ